MVCARAALATPWRVELGSAYLNGSDAEPGARRATLVEGERLMALAGAHGMDRALDRAVDSAKDYSAAHHCAAVSRWDGCMQGTGRGTLARVQAVR